MRIYSKYLSCLSLKAKSAFQAYSSDLFGRFLRKKSRNCRAFDLCCKLRLVFIKRLMCPKGWVVPGELFLEIASVDRA